MANRRINLDLFRILSCVLVIGIHFLNGLKSSGANDLVYNVIESIVRIGLPAFFVLTSVGLSSNEQYIKNTARFYINKFIDIIIPFVIFSVFYNFLSNGYFKNGLISLFSLNTVGYIYQAFLSMASTQQYYHLWYIYTLIGLYLFFPFLKVLLNNLDKKGVLCLIGISLLVRALRNYNLIAVGEYGITGWMIYYIIGYYCLKYVDDKKKANIVYILGIVSYVLIIICCQFNVNERWTNQLYSISIPMYFVTAAVFVAFLRIKDENWNQKTKEIISFVSSQTYLVYLIHPFVKRLVENTSWVNRINNCYIQYISLVLTVFIISLMISIILNWLIFKPMSKGLKFLIYRKQC